MFCSYGVVPTRTSLIWAVAPEGTVVIRNLSARAGNERRVQTSAAVANARMWIRAETAANNILTISYNNNAINTLLKPDKLSSKVLPGILLPIETRHRRGLANGDTLQIADLCARVRRA